MSDEDYNEIKKFIDGWEDEGEDFDLDVKKIGWIFEILLPNFAWCDVNLEEEKDNENYTFLSFIIY